jgi:protein SCO1/2
MLTGIALLAIGGVAPAQAPLPDIGIDQRLNESVPLDLTFADEHGDPVTLGALVNERPVILVLAYYCCPRLCNLSLNNLALSLGKIDYQAGRDYEVVVVSIDPRETPEIAASKKDALVPAGARAGWHLLTGKEAAIQRLAKAVGFRYAYDAQRDMYAHSSGVTILTPKGKVARYLFGLDYSPRDLRFALEDASAGAIGAPVIQPLRLLCFAYDPQAGAYTLQTMRLVKIAAGITVLVVGFFLLRAWRRERSSAAARK